MQTTFLFFDAVRRPAYVAMPGKTCHNESAVIPLFILIFLGYFLTCIGFFTRDFLKIANKLCFRILMPVNMFWTMYNGQGMAVSAIVTTTCFSIVSLCAFSVVLGAMGLF